MSKVFIDTDIVAKKLIPVANSECSSLSAARDYASSVNFPNGDFNWGSIKNDISDCVSQANTYKNWIEKQNSKYNASIQNAVSDIKSVTITEVKKQQFVVK